ncbi:MAG TPA: MOSC N-terminal beta barrel domain-containing protein [Gemmatimonadales bacterium]|jgi:hypothetical protein
MRITSLALYPIKGCRGVALDRADVGRLGLVGDRRLMLVDPGNRFISQREVAALATVIPTLADDILGVTAPGHGSLRICIDPDGPPRAVHLWTDRAIVATDQGDHASEWFSDAMGSPCRLVYFGREAINPIAAEYTPRVGAQTAFTDGFPMLATLEESLTALNLILPEAVPMDRFRPSVVVTGASAWSEDWWGAMRLGSIDADGVKSCKRCVVTTTDQVTGARDAAKEPLRTLARFRRDSGQDAIFGRYLVPRDSGVLSVGDEVVLG